MFIPFRPTDKSRRALTEGVRNFVIYIGSRLLNHSNKSDESVLFNSGQKMAQGVLYLVIC